MPRYRDVKDDYQISNLASAEVWEEQEIAVPFRTCPVLARKAVPTLIDASGSVIMPLVEKLHDLL